jgi:MFS family permease
MVNWVQKLNLLCKPQQLKWMTPVMALGVALALTLIPSIADKFGRKNVYNSSLVVSMIAQLALLLVDSSEVAIGLLFAIGATWPGRCIVGTVYTLEFFPESHQLGALLVILMANAVSISLIPLSFQILYRDFYLYQVLSLVMAFLSFTYCILLMPDSPWAYYMRDDF